MGGAGASERASELGESSSSQIKGDWLKLLPLSIRERGRRNPRSCGAAAASHTPEHGSRTQAPAAAEAGGEATGDGGRLRGGGGRPAATEGLGLASVLWQY
jgi:hypothetical protein